MANDLPEPTKPAGELGRSPADDAPLPSFDLTLESKPEPRRGPPPPPRRAPASTVPPQSRSAETSAPSVPSIPGPAPLPQDLTTASAARTPPVLARLSAYADAHRERLPAPLKRLFSNTSGTAIGLGALAVGTVLIGGLGFAAVATFRSLTAPAQSGSSAGELAESAPSAADSAPVAAPSAPLPAAPSNAGAALDEPTILLAQAERLLDEGRHADVLPLIDRLIARSPELKSDARVARILAKTAASNNARAAAESFSMLKGPMGEAGAEILYELSLRSDVAAGVRKRAELWLLGKEFARTAPLPLYAAVKLRQAKSCEEKHALLPFAADAGGKYVLEYLRELDQKTVCSPEALDDCFPCLRNDDRLSKALAKLQASG